jgi:outer membrane protein assembly factor BamB
VNLGRLITRKLEWALVLLVSLLIVQFYGAAASSVSVGSNTNDGHVLFNKLTVYSANTALSARVTQLWNLTIVDGSPFSSPVFSDGYLYVAASATFGYAYCLNASTGAQMWNYTLGDTGGSSATFSPVFAEGYVYVGASIVAQTQVSGITYCLNALTGAQMWNYTYESAMVLSPALANGYIYIASGYPSHGNVYALNASTGSPIWNYTTGSYIYSSPAVANNVVYVGAGNTVFALDAFNGAQIWNYTMGSIVGAPAVANGFVYIGSGNLVYALDASTGTEKWNTATQGTARGSSPALANGDVYVSSNDSVYCFDASTGSQVWNCTTGGEASSPVISGSNVYLGSDDLNVYCLDASTGDKIWNYTTLVGPLFPGLGRITYGPILSYSPAVADGVVYISLSAMALISTTGGDNIYAGLIYALAPAITVTPTPSPPASLSSSQLVAIAVVMAVVILAVLLLVYRMKRKEKQTTLQTRSGSD